MTIGRGKPQSGAEENALDEAGDPATPRRRGRPARLSREQVVEAVLTILEREPHEVPNIARIAREVKAVPAALYRHFASLDDILDSVLARVLETSPSDLEAGDSWRAQLATWMRELRSHLLRYPAVLTLLGRSGRTSPPWLDTSSALIEILERAGLSGDDRALTYLWILETTVGLVMQEAALPIPEQISKARASNRELSKAARARFAPLVREFERIDGDEFFSFAVEQATAIVALRARSSRKR